MRKKASSRLPNIFTDFAAPCSHHSQPPPMIPFCPRFDFFKKYRFVLGEPIAITCMSLPQSRPVANGHLGGSQVVNRQWSEIFHVKLPPLAYCRNGAAGVELGLALDLKAVHGHISIRYFTFSLSGKSKIAESQSRAKISDVTLTNALVLARLFRPELGTLIDSSLLQSSLCYYSIFCRSWIVPIDR